MILASAVSSFFLKGRSVDNSSYSGDCHSNPAPGVASLSGERGEPCVAAEERSHLLGD